MLLCHSRPQPRMTGPQMLAAYVKWREMNAPSSTTPRPLLIVGMSANSTQAGQDEAFKHEMHVFAAKPVESIYLKILIDAVKTSVAVGNKRNPRWSSLSSSSTSRTKQLNPIAKCLSDVKDMLKKEGLGTLSIHGEQSIRITSYPLRCDL